MARKASLSDTAPAVKQLKKEQPEPSSEIRVILDSDKVESATKAIGKIPKKQNSSTEEKSRETNEPSDKSVENIVTMVSL